MADDAFSLLDLPGEVLRLVVDRLTVHEKAMLSVACPARREFRATSAEKDLGVLCWAVRNGHVTQLTTKIRTFLRNVPKHSPTLQLIAERLPDVRDIPYLGPTPVCHYTLVGKVADGSLTAAEVPMLLEDCFWPSLLARATVETWQVVWNTEPGRQAITEMWGSSLASYRSLFTHVLLHDNMPLYDHLTSVCPEFRTAWALYVQNVRGDSALFYISMHGLDWVRRFIRVAGPFSRERSLELYREAIDRMMTEAALFFKRGFPP